MKALVILSHSWTPVHPLTCLYGTNELLWVSVAFWSIFVRRNSTRSPFQPTLHMNSYRDSVVMRNVYRIGLVLSNIINHGESDVQWQISI